MSIVADHPLKDSHADLPDLPWPLLQAVAALADASLAQIAERLRDATLPYIGSSALVIFTEDCTGRLQKKAGAEEIVSRVSITELEALRTILSDETPWFGDAELAGRIRPVLAVKYSPSNAILVLTDPHPTSPRHDSGLDVVEYLWRLTARRIQEQPSNIAGILSVAAQVLSALVTIVVVTRK